jgi:glycosyltransferase involved in cell wall biosynthesis
VLDARPHARLLVAGPGPLEDRLRAAVRDRGIDERLRFLGQRTDVPRLMQAADGYVMSSAWEGLPMVLLEAAASGLPIVTTEIGGARDVVVDGENGYIVPRADDAALAAAMLRVMDLAAEERAAMGRAALAHVAPFDMSVVAGTWDTIYRDALARARTGATDGRGSREGSG